MKKKTSKKNDDAKSFKIILGASIIIIMIIIVLIVCGLSKSKSVNNTDTIPNTNDAISIADEKLKEASSFLKNVKTKCDENVSSILCYYDTLGKFKDSFYNIYSKQLDFKDVFAEYKLNANSYDEFNTNVKTYDTIQGYAIDNNKVYLTKCTIGGGDYEKMDKLSIDSVMIDTIIVNYAVIMKDHDNENGQEYEYGSGRVTLVKEDKDWKILNATIPDMCNFIYEVGK